MEYFLDYIISTSFSYYLILQDNSKDRWAIFGNKLIAVLANGNRFNENGRYDLDAIEEFANKLFVKLNPEEKLNIVLNAIYNNTIHDGEFVALKTPTDNEANKLYFGNAREWDFYLSVAKEKRLINTPVHQGPIPFYQLTMDGLIHLIAVNNETSSTICFIAMAFTEDMFLTAKQAIKPALLQCGFEDYMVSDQHVDSDKTINDAILAGIKKARFTIADFTHHRGGVYFEAGYALGRGQKVIYTCREDEMTKAHFDIRNYQHIVWKDAADFKQKLINKIEAFIKE